MPYSACRGLGLKSDSELCSPLGDFEAFLTSRTKPQVTETAEVPSPGLQGLLGAALQRNRSGGWGEERKAFLADLLGAVQEIPLPWWPERCRRTVFAQHPRPQEAGGGRKLITSNLLCAGRV